MLLSGGYHCDSSLSPARRENRTHVTAGKKCRVNRNRRRDQGGGFAVNKPMMDQTIPNRQPSGTAAGTWSRVVRLIEGHPDVKQVRLNINEHSVSVGFYETPSEETLNDIKAAARPLRFAVQPKARAICLRDAPLGPLCTGAGLCQGATEEILCHAETGRR